MRRSAPDLSVVVPVYRGADHVTESLAQLASWLDSSRLDWEILPVDDGSPDRTGQVLSTLRSARIRPVLLPRNRGKYGALQAGVAQTKGRTVLLTDADIPYDLESVRTMFRLVTEAGFHIAVGDRTLPGSVYRQSLGPLRRLATSVFSGCVRLFVTGGLHDTQCGLKMLRGDAARALFPLLTEQGFSGDVELLYVALKHNLAIRRVPVRLVQAGPSTVRPFRDGLRMLQSLRRLRPNHRRGRYDSPELARLGALEEWWPPAIAKPASGIPAREGEAGTTA